MIGDLPEAVATSTRLSRQTKLVLYFVRTSADLDKALEHLAGQLPTGSSVWVIHPKRSGVVKPTSTRTTCAIARYHWAWSITKSARSANSGQG